MIFYEHLQEENKSLVDFDKLHIAVQRRLQFIWASYERYYHQNYTVTKKSKQRAVKKQLSNFIDGYKELALSPRNQEKLAKLAERDEKQRDANRIFHQSKSYGL